MQTACPSHRRARTPQLTCKATATEGAYRVSGTKAWITPGEIADFYNLFARTDEGSQGISCLLVPRDTEGLSFGIPERKMGLHAVPTTSGHYDSAFVGFLLADMAAAVDSACAMYLDAARRRPVVFAQCLESRTLSLQTPL